MTRFIQNLMKRNPQKFKDFTFKHPECRFDCYPVECFNKYIAFFFVLVILMFVLMALMFLYLKANHDQILNHSFLIEELLVDESPDEISK